MCSEYNFKIYNCVTSQLYPDIHVRKQMVFGHIRSFNVLVLNLSISQQKYKNTKIYELYSFLYLQQRFSFVSFSPHIKRQK